MWPDIKTNLQAALNMPLIERKITDHSPTETTDHAGLLPASTRLSPSPPPPPRVTQAPLPMPASRTGLKIIGLHFPSQDSCVEETPFLRHQDFFRSGWRVLVCWDIHKHTHTPFSLNHGSWVFIYLFFSHIFRPDLNFPSLLSFQFPTTTTTTSPLPQIHSSSFFFRKVQTSQEYQPVFMSVRFIYIYIMYIIVYIYTL